MKCVESYQPTIAHEIFLFSFPERNYTARDIDTALKIKWTDGICHIIVLASEESELFTRCYEAMLGRRELRPQECVVSSSMDE